MLILGTNDVKPLLAIPTSAGQREVMEFQGNYYLHQQTCRTPQDAASVCDRNFNQGSVSVILNRAGRSEIWVQARQQDLIARLLLLAQRSPAPQAASAHPNELIAYVDDSFTDGRRMERILAKFDLNCAYIPEAIRAIPQLIECKPSLIFLDLVMDYTNGYEVCAKLRRINGLKTVPIVMLTSTDTILDRARAKMAGVSEFLTKPFDEASIEATLVKHGIRIPVAA